MGVYTHSGSNHWPAPFVSREPTKELGDGRQLRTQCSFISLHFGRAPGFRLSGSEERLMVLQAFAAVNVLFFVLCAFAFVRRNDKLLVSILIVSCALTGVVSFAGTVWHPQKIAGLFCLASIVTCPGLLDLCGAQIRRNCILVVFCVLISLVSAYAWTPSQIASQESFTLQGSFLRPIVQSYAYISAIGVFAFVLAYLTQTGRPDRLLSLFFWTVFAASIVGWVHFAFLRMGWSFLPIPRYTGHASELAAFTADGKIVTRVYALSGEPKHFATLLLPGILLQFFLIALPDDSSITRLQATAGLILTFPLLILTYSTGAFISLLFGFAMVSVSIFGSHPQVVTRVILVGLTGVLGLFVFSLLNSDFLEALVSRIESRSVERLSTEYDTRLEYLAVEYILVQRPETLLFGLGPGMYNYHGFGGVSQNSGVQPMTSAWASILVDLGLLGTIAFWIIILKTLWAGVELLRSATCSGITAGAYGGLVGSVAAGIATGSLYLVMIFCALLLCLYRLTTDDGDISDDSL